MAFYWSNSLTDIVFPESLIEIGYSAFARTKLERVVLPENIQIIGASAFSGISTPTIQELYIPKGVQKINGNAFLILGRNISYRGYYQGFISCLPDFITEGNCKSVGIDEEAVRAYNAKQK